MPVIAAAVGYESRALDDGTVVELNGGAEIEVQFTAAERRLRLVRGEAHFQVAKNPLRPFVVEAGGVAVRAVGTAVGRNPISLLIPCHRVGRVVRYDLSAVLDAIEKKKGGKK